MEQPKTNREERADFIRMTNTKEELVQMVIELFDEIKALEVKEE